MFESLVSPTKQPWKAILYVSAFIKQHEKLLAIVLGAALVWGVVGKVNDAIAAHDSRTLAADTAKLQAEVAATAAQATANAKAAADYKALADKTAAANQALEQSNVALAVALSKQQKVDAGLPPTALAERIETLASLPPNSVVPQQSGYSVTAPAAVSIAQTLETVGTQKQEIANQQQEITNGATLLAAQTSRVDGLNKQIDNLGLQLTGADKVCTDKIAVVKADARKSKLKWFKAGVVVGFVAGVVTGHYIP